jgi:cell shape-determining protein MreC
MVVKRRRSKKPAIKESVIPVEKKRECKRIESLIIRKEGELKQLKEEKKALKRYCDSIDKKKPKRRKRHAA